MLYVACAFAVCSLALPSRALADEEEAVETPAAVSSPYVDYSAQLQSLSVGLGNVKTSIDDGRYEIQQHLVAIETLLTPVEEKEEDTKKEEKSAELKALEGISKQLEELTKDETVKIDEQEPVGLSKAGVSFDAYGNVSPTGTYASYAIGYLSRVGFGEHYVYLQDTSSSYVMCWGDLTSSGTNVNGSGNWVRWYYTNNYSYVMQYGSGQISIEAGNKVILSDLEPWPMLGDGTDVLRREVGFYAVVALCVFSLASVLGFTLRLRSYVVSD